MRIATYNILKGGSLRVHSVRMIEDHSVDLLLVQESYAHHEHLPPLMYPNAGKQSAWEMSTRTTKRRFVCWKGAASSKKDFFGKHFLKDGQFVDAKLFALLR